jgi:hypothetical protein
MIDRLITAGFLMRVSNFSWHLTLPAETTARG